MTIESIFPIENDILKIFFVDKVGPVLILKQHDEDGYHIQTVFSYQGTRTDVKVTFTPELTKEGVIDDDKAEERRDLAFQNMGQAHIKNAVEETLSMLYEITKDKEGDDESKYIEALPKVPQ